MAIVDIFKDINIGGTNCRLQISWPDFDWDEWGGGKNGTFCSETGSLLMKIFSGNSSLGDNSCLDPCDGLKYNFNVLLCAFLRHL